MREAESYLVESLLYGKTMIKLRQYAPLSVIFCLLLEIKYIVFSKFPNFEIYEIYLKIIYIIKMI